ncbi:hypothetical protein [Lolliginicoccus levis]|uniref:hypothetical protein n=1 Tax=Lolliginicoccus levis TaxID=2919542 RepID=UPI00241E08A0|nr:hypothetical protein [Lolliginicoccus levis]
MSTQRRRAAFSPDALDSDIDSLLPPAPTPLRRPAPAPAPVEEQRGEAGGSRSADAAPAPAPAVSPARTVARPRTGAPEVVIAPEVHAALRRLTARERERHPERARSFGVVVLDAVEAHAEQLARHWARPEPAGSGLFQRADGSRPRRRRHAAAPARIPLSGIIPADVAVLDGLVEQWGAGSRSALVEQALRWYLGMDKA